MTDPSAKDDPHSDFPKGYLQLFSDAKVSEACERLVVLFHTFMLDVGFIPKDVDTTKIYKSMPENWRAAGIFNISYSHKTIPDVFCRVTYVPLYSNLAIHGVLESNENEDQNVYLKLKVNAKENAANPLSILPGLQKLSMHFKDEFCFPLLVLIQESVNYEPPFGLSGLINEAKFIILTLLPVESVVSMSAVNKDFHNQVNSSFLWKCLFHRDFDAGYLNNGSSSSSEENWKEMYKKQYLEKKKWPKRLRSRYMQYFEPEIYPIRSNYDSNFDLSIDMDPALQQAFPLMRNRFRPSYWFYRSESNPFNPWFY